MERKFEEAMKAIRVMSEMGVLFMRAAKKAGATKEEAYEITRAYYSAMIAESMGKNKDGGQK